MTVFLSSRCAGTVARRRQPSPFIAWIRASGSTSSGNNSSLYLVALFMASPRSRSRVILTIQLGNGLPYCTVRLDDGGGRRGVGQWFAPGDLAEVIVELAGPEPRWGRWGTLKARSSPTAARRRTG